MKKLFSGRRLPVALRLTLLGGWLAAAGCEWNDRDDFDHTPPAGQGAVVVDNRTFTDIEVFLNGARVGRVGDYDWRAFDRAPGVCRLVLNEDDGRRYYSDDVDIIANRRTIVEVDTADGSSTRYDVRIRLD